MPGSGSEGISAQLSSFRTRTRTARTGASKPLICTHWDIPGAGAGTTWATAERPPSRTKPQHHGHDPPDLGASTSLSGRFSPQPGPLPRQGPQRVWVWNILDLEAFYFKPRLHSVNKPKNLHTRTSAYLSTEAQAETHTKTGAHM